MMGMDRKSIVAALAGGAIVGLAWLVWGELADGVPRYVAPPGNIWVNYTVQTGANTSESGKIKRVRSIEFHPNYVVVNENSKAGRVFFAAHTQSLSWADYAGAP